MIKPAWYLREGEKLVKEFMELPGDEGDFDDFIQKNASDEYKEFSRKYLERKERLDANGIIED